MKYPKQKWLWGDMHKDFERLKLGKYDVIVCNFSVQYILPYLGDFLKELEKVSNEKTIWCFAFMGDIDHEFVKRDDRKLIVDFPWAEKHKEHVLTMEMMEEEISKLGRKVINYKPDIGVIEGMSDRYKKLWGCYRWVVCVNP
jgi:hypothetical protein